MTGALTLVIDRSIRGHSVLICIMLLECELTYIYFLNLFIIFFIFYSFNVALFLLLYIGGALASKVLVNILLYTSSGARVICKDGT